MKHQKGILLSIFKDNVELLPGSVALTDMFPGIPDFDMWEERLFDWASDGAALAYVHEHNMPMLWDGHVQVTLIEGELVPFCALRDHVDEAEFDEFEGRQYDILWETYKRAVKATIEHLLGPWFSVTVERLSLHKGGFTPDIIRLTPSRSWRESGRVLLEEGAMDFLTPEDVKDFCRAYDCTSWKQITQVALMQRADERDIQQTWQRKIEIEGRYL